MDATAAALGVPVTIVGDGDHWSTFTDVDALVPLVLGHLERVAISPTAGPRLTLVGAEPPAPGYH